LAASWEAAGCPGCLQLDHAPGGVVHLRDCQAEPVPQKPQPFAAGPAAHLLQAPHLKLISDAVRWACRVRCFLREPLNRLFVIWYRMVLPHCGLPVASFRW
jgi:hypothetical protein